MLTLYDWGIHHLYLGETFSAPGYVKRTGPVLFAVFRKNDVYFIDIIDHLSSITSSFAITSLTNSMNCSFAFCFTIFFKLFFSS